MKHYKRKRPYSGTFDFLMTTSKHIYIQNCEIIFGNRKGPCFAPFFPLPHQACIYVNKILSVFLYSRLKSSCPEEDLLQECFKLCHLSVHEYHSIKILFVWLVSVRALRVNIQNNLWMCLQSPENHGDVCKTWSNI